MKAGWVALGLLAAGLAHADELPTYLRAPVLRGLGSSGETAITAEVLAAAALLLTASPGWSEWPGATPPSCATGCRVVEAHCAGTQTQRCEVSVSELPGGRQAVGQLTLRELAPATDVAQALVLQAAYLLEKLRQSPVEPPRGPALAEPREVPRDDWSASIGPSLLFSSGILAWGLEAATEIGVSERAFVRVGLGYAGLFASQSGGSLDYFHAVPLTASFGVRASRDRLSASASLGLLVMPVFASADHVPDSDLAVDGCVELALRYRLGDVFWLSILARPYYGSGDVTLGEAGPEPFILPKWGVLGGLQIGTRL